MMIALVLFQPPIYMRSTLFVQLREHQCVAPLDPGPSGDYRSPLRNCPLGMCPSPLSGLWEVKARQPGAVQKL